MSWLNGRTVEHLNSSIFVKFFNISTIKLKNLFTTHYLQFTKKLFAFTLAETLIVMGVIGVVAALTLPNLNSSTNNKEKVAKVKKIYQNLDDAFGRATAVYGPYEEWPATDSIQESNLIYNRLKEFMKISKDCGTESSGCFDKYKISSYYIDEEVNINGPSLILSDGTALAIMGTSVSVDIDGPNNGTGTLGKDVFLFEIEQDDNGNYTIKPEGFGFSSSGILRNCLKYRLRCTAWVINNGNMDYLYADENGKCENSNVTLSETVTSCN